ncbi:MAG: tetratricopeptide repeat protein [Chloroflexi bacterium]|nr:tetratricopeptide repeat protein [Chloroflexota bacterium]
MNNISDLLSRGMELGQEGRWEEATGLLRQLVVEDAGNFEAWLWLGAMAEDPQDAVECLEKALALRPTSVRAQKGIGWARERLGEAKAPEAPTSLSAAPDEASDLPAPFSAGPATVEPETLSPQVLPGDPQGEPVEAEETAPPPAEEASSPESPASDEAWWRKDNAFFEQSLSPISPAGEDVSSLPPAPETYGSGLVELPRAILSAFQHDEDPGEEENPFAVSSAGEIGGQPNAAGSFTPPDEQPIFPLPDITMQPGEYSAKLPSFDEDTAEFRLDALGLPGAEPAPTLPEPFDVGPAGAPAESWDALIARLQSLESQAPQEPQEPIAGEDAIDAVTGDLAPASDLVAPPLRPEYRDEEAVIDQPEAYSPDLAMAVPLPEPVDEKKVSALVEKAKLDLEAGRLTEAMDDLSEALSLDANHVEANEQLGIVQYQGGNLDAAIAAFQTVVSLRPDQAEGHANLGFLFAEKGETGAAMAAFHEAIRCDRELAEAHLGLADLCKGRGDMDGAIEQWREATRLRPDWTDASANLAEAYAERGQVEDAMREFRNVAERKPGDARAHLRLGQLLWKSGAAVEAARAYREAIRLAPSLAEAHYGLACCLEEAGSWSDAIVELEKALAIRPDFLEADEKLGRLRVAMTPAQEDAVRKEEREEQEKKPRWRIFGRDK